MVLDEKSDGFGSSDESGRKEWGMHVGDSDEAEDGAGVVERLPNRDSSSLSMSTTEASDKGMSSHEGRMTRGCREGCLLEFKFLGPVAIYSLLSMYFACAKAFYIDQ